MAKIIVQNTEINVVKVNNEDYICLTDMIKAKDGDSFVTDRLRNRNTLEYLGIWENLYNPNFNYGEFATIRNQSGLNINNSLGDSYQTEDGQTQIDVRLENETVWLTQAQMAELFDTDRTSIVRHINNIYRVDELDREATCAKNAQVQTEGKRQVTRTIPYFNLDMIISVGYRVRTLKILCGTDALRR